MVQLLLMVLLHMAKMVKVDGREYLFMVDERALEVCHEETSCWFTFHDDEHNWALSTFSALKRHVS